MTAQSACVGVALERIEDPRLLRGEGRYVDDLHASGLLHMAIVRSPVAHGRIRSIDTSEALRMPGVHAIYTGRDLAKDYDGRVPTIPLRLWPLPTLAPFEQCVIALDKVRWVGEPLAVVVAATPGQAEDAADRVAFDIEPLAPVASWQAAAQDESLLFEGHGTNVAITYTARKGDAHRDFGRNV